MNIAKGPLDQGRAMVGIRPEFFKPIVGLERGLTDPITELNMGQTAEVLAHRFSIDRAAADTYAMQSHHRLAAAQSEGRLVGEVMPAFSRNGTVYEHDDGVRPDNSMEQLGKLAPVFEPPYGKVTAGNSSRITDGASWCILASEQAVDAHRLQPLAEIIDSEWAGLDPSIMGLAPVLAATPIAQRHEFSVDDIDLWELNEAFAA